MYCFFCCLGTVAGTIDDSFESKSHLEIYDISLGIPHHQPTLLGSITSKDCFHSIAWGNKGIDDGTFSAGLIAGGMSDGSVNIWNAASILQHDQNSALISRSEHHKGQVLGLQFHPQQPNLLASGATDGEVFVWDLANPSSPSPSKPNPTAQKVGNHGVTSVSWNKKVPQILASANEIGETTVWDLRQKRSIITFRNSARLQVRASALSWNPDASVQLAVCYANHPCVEIWDLRQSMTPKVKLEGIHHGSILALDWSTHDSSILLSSGEDGRIVAWDALHGQYLHEYPQQAQCFDLQWSPTIPNLYSSCSYDGKVNINSINSTGPNHVPNWLAKSTGASFGFGGKLVTFGTEQTPKQDKTAPTQTPIAPPKVSLQQLVTDPEVLGLAAGFQQVIEHQQFPQFCAEKASTAENEDEKTTWTFMKILFEDERSQRLLLLRELGFEPPPSSEIVMPQPTVVAAAPTPQPEVSEEDFFNQDFPTPAPEASPEPQPTPKQQEAKEEEYKEDSDDQFIREALVFGDFKSAVDRCLSTNRMADAIIFSSFGPPSLWEETRAAYFAQHKSPFIRNVMKSVSNQSLDEMVATSDLTQWKETLGILITYTTTEKYRQLVNQLAFRLESAGQSTAAVVCYMCSSNIDKTIDMWCSRAGQTATDGQSSLIALHKAVEKIAVFARATSAHGGSQLLSQKYSEYAQMLASQGSLSAAWDYLRVANPSGQDVQSAALVDRIFHASSLEGRMQPPVFPFHRENVNVDPALAQHEAQLAQARALKAQQQQQEAMAQQQAALRAQQQAAQAQHQMQPQQQTPYGQPMHPQQQQQYGQQPPAQQFGQMSLQQQQPQRPPQQMPGQFPPQQQQHGFPQQHAQPMPGQSFGGPQVPQQHQPPQQLQL